MKRSMKILAIGCFFFLLVTIGVVSLVFIKCFFMGLNFDFRIAVIAGAKGGIVTGIAIMIVYFIGGPRPMTPGGR
jgi:hypothetical protein